jgi:serine/threonine protein kinase
MLEAVKEVHSTGRIHRDIKPDNFLVHQGRVYITDFGTIAKFLDD